MPERKKIASISTAAARAFDEAERADWSQGVPLSELLDRINRVAERLLPDDRRDSRVSRTFTPRSFRRYQTLGCIDAPQRDGQRVVYGFGHFVQALLVRKLLWGGMSAERIVVELDGLSSTGARALLFDRSEIATADADVEFEGGAPSCGRGEAWTRFVVMPGIELHLQDDLPPLTSRQVEGLLVRIERVLRSELG